MSKILFSDFDGTLFFKEGFHQEDIEAIQTFQEAGNKFALCQEDHWVVYLLYKEEQKIRH